MTAINKDDHGFSLVELMVGILIVSIGVLALYQMFVVGSQLITEEYHRRLGLERAQALMEGVNYYPTQGEPVPVELSGTHHEILVPGSEGDDDGIQGSYTMVVVHSSDLYPYSSQPIYSDVSILYSWVEKSGRHQSIRLQSYF
jgi:prepilin-type N-terminal cleavage/methylation domain-containing protein